MISEYYVKQYCSEDISLIENYQAAVEDTTQTWDCHHRAEILPCGIYSQEDLKKFGLFEAQPADMLIFLTVKEHHRLHNQHRLRENHPMFGKHHSEAARKKMSEAKRGEKNHMFGRHHTKEANQKNSEAHRGENNPMFGKRHIDSTKEKMSKSLRGMHWWNNSIISKFARECPGLEWKRGRLQNKKKQPHVEGETLVL